MNETTPIFSDILEIGVFKIITLPNIHFYNLNNCTKLLNLAALVA